MSITFMYGLYAALASLVLLLIEYFTGLDKSAAGQSLQYLNYLFLAMAIYFGIRQRKREEFDNDITYGQSFGTGTLVSLFAAVLIGIFSYVYLTYINPDFLDYVSQQQVLALKQRHMSAQSMEQASAMIRKWTTPSIAVIFGFFFTFFFGVILSLIISFFTRSKERPIETQMIV